MAGLHSECDWLLKNFELRKEARAGEIESLKASCSLLTRLKFACVNVRLCRSSMKTFVAEDRKEIHRTRATTMSYHLALSSGRHPMHIHATRHAMRAGLGHCAVPLYGCSGCKSSVGRCRLLLRSAVAMLGAQSSQGCQSARKSVNSVQ
eukprot:6075316-Amphidinium_carterae.1